MLFKLQDALIERTFPPRWIKQSISYIQTDEPTLIIENILFKSADKNKQAYFFVKNVLYFMLRVYKNWSVLLSYSFITIRQYLCLVFVHFIYTYHIYILTIYESMGNKIWNYVLMLNTVKRHIVIFQIYIVLLINIIIVDLYYKILSEGNYYRKFFSIKKLLNIISTKK